MRTNRISTGASPARVGIGVVTGVAVAVGVASVTVGEADGYELGRSADAGGVAEGGAWLEVGPACGGGATQAVPSAAAARTTGAALSQAVHVVNRGFEGADISGDYSPASGSPVTRPSSKRK
jgi:hypothetical protein